ncbi:MAG: toll/interleukin-1 receptor domain-containing protein [Candidatus Korobacteraceae bacterium]|jgi:hypothetical protein
MKSKVFVSCGQQPAEKEVAAKVASLLRDRGFNAYVAIDVQTILDINGGIIHELKNSDCYLFINFRRDKIGDKYRGSLFANQELAIAYALGFERFLVVNQEDVRPEGMLAYIGINTETFATLDECSAAVERALDRAKWTPEYSRRLRTGELRFSDDVLGYQNLRGRFLYLDIKNGRPDIAAMEVTARLVEIAPVGAPWELCRTRSPLKATGRPGFAQTIFPRSHEAFDLLCVGAYLGPTQRGPQYGPPGVYLNCALDAVLPPLPIAIGVWMLRYEFVALEFPPLSVTIELTIQDWGRPSAKIVEEEVI